MVKELKTGAHIQLTNGSTAVIKKLLGEGGQGCVYLVSVNDKDYALKVYGKKPSVKFLQNLDENIKKGAPTHHFLWPIASIAPTSRLYGYLMNLRPTDYADFTKFLTARVRFTSWTAMINTALQVTYAFQELHRKGLSYQDLNDGNFFFNPQTGDVLICDNDNVCPPDMNLGIKGKDRFMAPEIIIGKNKPNTLSDYFSLSVILFMIFFNNHPLDGKRVSSQPCMTDAVSKIVYGTQPVFIYDTMDCNNRPVMGIHSNVIIRWKLFPQFVKDAFLQQFSKEIMANPNKRMPESEWFKILLQLRNQTILCSCGNETFVNLHETSNCFNCGNSMGNPLVLKQGKQEIALYPGMKIHADITSNSDDFFKITGGVTRSKNNPNIWGITNKSGSTWHCVMPNGQEIDILDGKGFPIYKGVKVTFTTGKTAEIQ